MSSLIQKNTFSQEEAYYFGKVYNILKDISDDLYAEDCEDTDDFTKTEFARAALGSFMDFHDLNYEEPEQSGTNYRDKARNRYIMAVTDTNFYAVEKDVNRNHTNYGSVTAWAEILQDFGCKTFTAVWEDGSGCLRVPYITIDDEKIEFEKGKRED